MTSKKCLAYVSISILALLITGCTKTYMIFPQSESNIPIRYNCTRDIRLDDSSKNFSVTASKTAADSFKIDLGSTLTTTLEQTFPPQNADLPPITISFGDATEARYGTTIFSDNTVKVELVAHDPLHKVYQENASFIEQFGKPTGGSAGFSAMFGFIGYQNVTLPALKESFSYSSAQAIKKVVARLADDLLSNGTCAAI